MTARKSIPISAIATIADLPKAILDEARELLKGEDTEVDVIRWNRRIRVVGHTVPYEHSMDERHVLTIREDELFTEDERTENYINHYQKYPKWYAGVRSEETLERMKKDTDYEFDPKRGTLTCLKPVGRMIGGNFIYSGNRRVVVAG